MNATPSNIILIGLMGKAGAGKSHTAMLLQNFFGYNYEYIPHILPFAKPLKDLALSLGWDGKKDENGRLILNALGTEVCRRIDPDYWVKKWTQEYYELMIRFRGVTVIIVDDVRFVNEAQTIEALGGRLITVVNDDVPQLDLVSEVGLKHFTSKKPMLYFDNTPKNRLGGEDLEYALSCLLYIIKNN